LPDDLTVNRFFIKSPVFPFAKFPGVDPILSPEMHSTGEVMGVGETFGEAYGKAMTGAGLELPQTKARPSSASTMRTKGRRSCWRASWRGSVLKIVATLGTARACAKSG
jgi:carbamoyl-phosphate synthase large subunit